MWEVTVNFKSYRDAERFIEQVQQNGGVLIGFGKSHREIAPATIKEKDDESTVG